jgi:hypothetical protein
LNRIPPSAEIIDAVKWIVAPSALAALATLIVLSVLFKLLSSKWNGDWRQAIPAVSVLAVALSVIAVNHYRGDRENYSGAAFPWLPDGKWWHFGGWAIAAGFLVELIAQSIPSRPIGFLLRGLTAGVIAHFLVPVAWQSEARWWVPAAATWLAVAWSIAAELAHRQPGGAMAFAASFFAGGAGIVLLHATSLGFSDVASGLSVSLFVAAIFAWIIRSSTSAAAAAAIVPVLTLIWLNRPLVDSQVPITCHRIFACTPILLGVLLLPRLNRILGTRTGGLAIIALTLIPVGIAVAIAVTTAPMNFDEEKW